MGANLRHSYASVSGPSNALREVIAKRWFIASDELIGVSRRVESLPAILKDGLRAYWYSCMACKFTLEAEVAREMWPLLEAKLSNLGGMLESWLLRGKDDPRGGWIYCNLRYRQLGDSADGTMMQRRRPPIEIFRKTREEYDARGFMLPTRGRLRKVRREWEILGSAGEEASRFSVRDIFGR